MSEKKFHQLAVYGTLKKGFPNHKSYLWESEYLGTCFVNNFALAKETSANYPFAFRFPERSILVEVYKVDDYTMAHTDQLEGVNTGYYAREVVDTNWGPAHIYTQTSRTMSLKDRWYPKGVWLGAYTPDVAWLGWDREIKICSEEKKVRLNNANEGILGTAPPLAIQRPEYNNHGRMVKIYVPEKDEYEYVPAHEAVGKPREKPKPPTKMEIAREMIKEQTKDKSDIPAEEVA